METFANIKQLRDQLEFILAGELGTYSRPPPLPDIPAIHETHRPRPSNYKVVVAPIEQPLIPAIELVIKSHPDIIPTGRTIRDRFINEVYTVWLIFHDMRQDPAHINRLILANFHGASEGIYLAANDTMPTQLIITFTHKNSITGNY